MSDINPKALRYSKINALLNEVLNARAIRSDIFRQIDERANIVISNPPYLVDRAQRLYRHGGGELGFDRSVRIVEESLDRLLPAGMLLLYTGAPIINGKDQLFHQPSNFTSGGKTLVARESKRSRATRFPSLGTGPPTEALTAAGGLHRRAITQRPSPFQIEGLRGGEQSALPLG